VSESVLFSSSDEFSLSGIGSKSSVISLSNIFSESWDVALSLSEKWKSSYELSVSLFVKASGSVTASEPLDFTQEVIVSEEFNMTCTVWKYGEDFSSGEESLSVSSFDKQDVSQNSYGTDVYYSLESSTQSIVSTPLAQLSGMTFVSEEVTHGGKYSLISYTSGNMRDSLLEKSSNGKSSKYGMENKTMRQGRTGLLYILCILILAFVGCGFLVRSVLGELAIHRFHCRDLLKDTKESLNYQFDENPD
jgi:hypothetical protein